MGVNNAYVGTSKLGNLGAVFGSPVQLVAAGTTGVTVAFATTESGPNTITVAGTTVSVEVGQIVQVTGAASSTNNGPKTVVSLNTAGTIITVEETLANAAGSGSVALVALPLN